MSSNSINTINQVTPEKVVNNNNIMSNKGHDNNKTMEASPESVPSVADTSYASSPEDELKSHLPTRRTLFTVEGDEDDSKTTLAESTEVQPSPSKNSPVNYETVLSQELDYDVSDAASVTASTTSSETTVIPSWNLSSKNATDSDVEVPLSYFLLSPQSSPDLLSPPSSLTSKRIHTMREHGLPAGFSKEPGLIFEEAMPYYAQKEADKENDPGRANQAQPTPIMVEEPPEETTSCNSALNVTPKQLAEIFLAFGQSATWQNQRRAADQFEQTSSTVSTTTLASPVKNYRSTEDGDQKETTPPIQSSSPISNSSSGSENSPSSWTPRVRSLERECNALKKIIQQDAHTILNLQRAIEAQKQLCALKEVEIVDKQTELQISEERIARLKKEREDYIERETELVETIRILKQEVDKMTLKSLNSFDRIEMERMEAELTMASSQVDEQQVRIVELETALKVSDENNFNLLTQIDWIENQHKKDLEEEQDRQPAEVTDSRDAEGRAQSNDEDKVIGDPSTAVVLAMLEDISKRLASLEREKRETENIVMEELKRNKAEMEELRGFLKLDSELEDNTIVQVSAEPEAIEAMPLQNNGYTNEEEMTQFSCCCDWSTISGN